MELIAQVSILAQWIILLLQLMLLGKRLSHKMKCSLTIALWSMDFLIAMVKSVKMTKDPATIYVAKHAHSSAVLFGLILLCHNNISLSYSRNIFHYTSQLSWGSILLSSIVWWFTSKPISSEMVLPRWAVLLACKNTAYPSQISIAVVHDYLKRCSVKFLILTLINYKEIN